MTQHAFTLISAAMLLSVSGMSALADSDTETRLRDALRSAIEQQRSLEDERATFLAKQSESDKQIEALKAQLDALSKAPKKPDTAPEMAALTQRVSQQGAEIAQLNQTLDKWKAAYNDAVAVARAKEAERAKLATDDAALSKRATGCETRNAALYKVGSEILDRLQKVSLGDVIAQDEPFTGIKRVELQNLVQDEQDKLLDQKVAP